MTIKLLPCALMALGLLITCSPGTPEKPVETTPRPMRPRSSIHPRAPPITPNIAKRRRASGQSGAGRTDSGIASSASRHVTFGIARADAVADLSRPLGSRLREANGGIAAPVRSRVPLSGRVLALFPDGKFGGWDLDRRRIAGSPRAAASASAPATQGAGAAAGTVDVGETTIGNEFADGRAFRPAQLACTHDGKVTNLWASVTCIAR